MLPSKIAFVDIETTGASANRDRIIEIGIIRVEDNKVVENYKRLINPGCTVPSEIFALTGISAKDLENAGSFYEYKAEIMRVLGDCVFVAHNVRFDYSFIKNEFKRFEIDFSPKHFCTVRLSKTLYPMFKHHNLDSLIQRFNLECISRHRAYDDASALWQFYQILLKTFSEADISNAIDRISKRPSVPLNIQPEELENLTDCAGIYIFWGEHNTPLYVGKSINIKKRVLSHFSSDHLSNKEMKLAQLTCRIQTMKTAGELGALIKESQLIKQLQPLYNKRSRYSKSLVIIRGAIDKNGYKTVKIETVDSLTGEDLPTTLGIFKSTSQAKDFLFSLAQEHQLCPKLLNVESSKTRCFAYGLGRCKGACINKENKSLYNARFELAFINTKLRSWPFKGGVVVTEMNNDHELADRFMVYDWCLVGTGGGRINAGKGIFDVEIYKILNRFLRQKPTLNISIKLAKQTTRLTKDEDCFVDGSNGLLE